jgi:hypothetical protein
MLLERWKGRERLSDRAWHEADDLSLDDLIRLTGLMSHGADEHDRAAALAFLAMSQSEIGQAALRFALQSTDSRLVTSALTAVAHHWPDRRFQSFAERYGRDTAGARAARIEAALALYRMGAREGFEILVEQGIGDGSERHDSVWRLHACHYLARFTRAQDRAALLPLVGRGAYFHVALRLIADYGDELIALLKALPPARFPDYVAFTLCRLNDPDSVERTQSVLMNPDRNASVDYPLVWALDALVDPRVDPRGPTDWENLCAFLLAFLRREIDRPNAGDWTLIHRAVEDLPRCRCGGASCHAMLERLSGHAKRPDVWTPDVRALMLSVIERSRKDLR